MDAFSPAPTKKLITHEEGSKNRFKGCMTLGWKGGGNTEENH